ncbi:MAG: hypothetical protein Q8L15_05025 [Methylobacter sp.]|nr:hypothetical protein [Methylobacter sp.]
MTECQKLTISKLDAAKRQLETVIRLYFAYGDPVAIHTLTSAAYNVIRDINKKRGGSPLIAKDGFLDYIKEGHEKEVRDLINAAENFFKHADRDYDSTIDFNPEQSEFLILEACGAYWKLTGEFPPLFRVYQSWFIAHHQALFNFPEEQKRLIALSASAVTTVSREQFFTQALPALMKPYA